MRKIYYGDYEYMMRLEEQKRRSAARAKQVKQQKIILALGIFITILICTLFSIRAFVYAEDDLSKNSFTKEYKSICIYCGDTLESIASEYCNEDIISTKEYINEIKSINHLDNTKLIPGNYIVVPFYSDNSELVSNNCINIVLD